MAYYGHAGKLLRVSLTDGVSSTEPISQEILNSYLGGVGLGAYYLYTELEPGIDPLSPENKLYLGTSPLSENRFPGGGSVLLSFKSPLTGGWGESRCGGDFGPMIRKAGFDAIIIEGQSDTPVYLAITDGVCEIHNGSHLTGKMVGAKQEIVQSEIEGSQVLCIGPAGENGVAYATAMCGHRAAGRTGVGTLMGSKNLLAIAVSGKQQIPVADKDRLTEVLREAHGVIRESETAAEFKEHGTAGDIPSNDAAGDWPTKNWKSNSWGKGEELYDSFFKSNLERSNPCYKGCTIACGRIASVKQGKYETPSHEGSEYESLSAFTAFVCSDNMDAAVHATWLCNEYGLDTISAGASIAFAMECAENGLLDRFEEKDSLTWGNTEVLAELVKKISLKEGIGALLSKGVRAASADIGPESASFAIHCKGLEGPAHDSRSGKALAVAYGTASRGMCHIHSLEGMAYDSGKMDWGLTAHGLKDPNEVDRWDEKGKGKAVKLLQDGLIIPDVLDVCKFYMYAGISFGHLAEMMSASTGTEISVKDLLRAGERVINLQRMFNNREGFGRKDDQLPTRALAKPEFGLYVDEPQCAISDFDAMLDEYYEARGWDEQGTPTNEKLEELGLQSMRG